VRLVWIINPESESVTIWRPDWSNQRLHKGDLLTGEMVLPQFTVPVDDLFPNLEDIL
jgi:Uma2 family endonuclease